MKQKITLLILILILLESLVPLVPATQITNVAPTLHSTYNKGDPYTTVYIPSEIAPPDVTKPPKIEIISMANNTIISSNNLTLTFNLALEAPNTYYPIILQGICYKPSWQPDNTTIDFGSNNKFYNKTLPFSISFTNITDGAKSVTIYTSVLYEFETGRENKQVIYGPGEFLKGNYLYIYSNFYFIEGSASVDFTIDTSPTITPIPKSDLDTTDILLYTLGTTVLIIAVTVSLLKYHKKHKAKAT